MTNRDQPVKRRRPRARRAVTPSPEMVANAIAFDPVPRRCERHDGWTPDRQRAFIQALAETGCVLRACKRIGMTTVGAYLLRRQPGAEDFARAWAQAQAIGVERLEDVAFDRAMNGVAVPLMYKGEQVGERRWYNDRLLMFTLRHHKPERYGGHRTAPAPHLRDAAWHAARTEAQGREAAVRAEMLARIDEAIACHDRRLEAAAEEARARAEGREAEADRMVQEIAYLDLLLAAPGLSAAIEEAHAWAADGPLPRRPAPDIDAEPTP